MESPVVRVIMIAVGVAAAGAVAAILWAQLNTSSAKIQDTPLVDYPAITTEVICTGAGGQWSSVTGCRASGSTPNYAAIKTQAACLAESPQGTWTDNDTDGDADPTTMPDDGTCSA